MTFVVQQLAAVRSLPGSNGQPLIAEAGNRLWLLTVSVRNDSQAVEADPFCRGERGRIRLGADLWTRQGWIHNWWIKSKLIDGNDQLCGDIQPGSTETHQLLYTVPKNRPAITGVTLGHRAPGSDDFTFAFVARQLHSGSAAVSNGQNDWLTSVRQLPN